ncbi:endonuclease/exonuclease/phosphatase family protein [Nocardioides islandensis]|uniref:Endonuclease/exonuclease/phosphatase family protein n=1 Tax=Nocardioides islandensis TaxID=433663 RepID=A0A930YJP9_9ACTN|nr:endonuclease/exonuclease/phosphatase family protein [Nocardioides islandensis]MBF4762900.1 endonuclease/exonuclease/phosphatase family protein [Nocardioides islandensis]
MCVTTAVVVTVGMRNQSQATTDATLDLASQVPLAPPTKDVNRGASAARSSTLISRGAEAGRGRAGKQQAARPQPQKVVGGGLIVHKTKAQINASLRRAAEREAARQTMTFQIGTFNVLGSQHSTPTGDHRKYPPASVRSPRAVQRIRSFGVDILGTQELQPDQLNAIQSMTGYAAYPGYAFGPRETDNTIFYDDSRFEFVSGSSFTIHFMHADRPQTILRLRDKQTGREFYVLNMHASAGFGPYAVTRRAGHYIAANTVNRLKGEGIPIFLTGDMNDRAEFFCRVAPMTGMVAAIGGSISGGCHPAGALAVDWVLGWGNVSFSNYIEDRSTMRTTSDHYFVSATATVGPMS